MSEPEIVFQILVTLLDVRPAVWRRLLVRSGLTLPRLHRLLQAAVGWDDVHLHAFRAGGSEYGPPGAECMDERRVRLADAIGAGGGACLYEYDFGDGWRHSVVVERVLAAEPDVDTATGVT